MKSLLKNEYLQQKDSTLHFVNQRKVVQKYRFESQLASSRG